MPRTPYLGIVLSESTLQQYACYDKKYKMSYARVMMQSHKHLCVVTAEVRQGFAGSGFGV